jgi:hypothetical protein
MKKKTLPLAQFKRDAKTGHMGLELIERYGVKIPHPIVSPVVGVLTESVKIKRGSDESYLDIPYASLVEYTGDMLKVYSIGKRPLNEQEKQVLNAWKKIENTSDFQKRSEIDALTDGSSTYWQQKGFFEKSPCPYLFTDTRSLRYDKKSNMVYDSKIKGECILIYRVHRI